MFHRRSSSADKATAKHKMSTLDNYKEKRQKFKKGQIKISVYGKVPKGKTLLQLKHILRF